MSTLRSIWNDGQALTTGELQRNNDVAGYMDDRVDEFLIWPGSVLKKVLPLSEESGSVYPRTLIAPGASAGTVQLNPCRLIAGTAVGTVAISAQIASLLASAQVTSNASGNPRIDLVYATVSRSVPSNASSPPAQTAYAGLGQASLGSPATGAQSRRIKDVSSGAVTTQTINVYDVPTVTITILPGTPAGSPVAPSLPADSGGAYNFSLATIAVANGYTAGTAITASNITQTWSGGWIQPQRVRGWRPMSIYSGSTVEKPSGSLPSDRWGSDLRFFAHFKLTPGSPTSAGTADLLDNSIDWRFRAIKFEYAYLGSATLLPMETMGSTPGANLTGYSSYVPAAGITFNSLTYGSTATLGLAFDSSGALRVYKPGTLVDGTNGDLLLLWMQATDQFKAGM